MDVRRPRAGRFSLLLLDDGEVLVSDIACQYRFIPNSNLPSPVSALASRLCGEMRIGRAKLGTHNIYFDSDDWRDPVVKIPIPSVTCVALSRVPSRTFSTPRNLISPSSPSPRSHSTTPLWGSPRRSAEYLRIPVDMSQSSPSLQPKTDTVVVDSKVVIFQREHGDDHPYVDALVDGKHIFTPTYSEGTVLEAELQSLKDINAITSRRGRESALRGLVREREERIPFDITILEQGSAEVDGGDYAASAIYALSRAPGRVKITSKTLYFMPIHGDANRSVDRILLDSLVSIRRLRHGCSNAALEVAFSANEASSAAQAHSASLKTLMLAFQNTEAREQAFSTLVASTKKKIDIYDKNELDLALAKWRRGEMSNYDYLMYLNLSSGRSFNDLSQYPVFPWILSDYVSKDLNIKDPRMFRDLSKPIGALDEARLAALKERYQEMPPPRFFYGTHYSAPAYLINYLVRAAPGAMLRLQNGRFDMPDRLFHSIAETWKGVCTNPADVKELIPEFYTVDYSESVSSGIVSSIAAPGQFLENVLGLELGIRQDGKRVDAVELPPWAKGSSVKFVRKLREALESRTASEKLHQWIDLIFGVKSRSEEACNIFYTDVALPNSLNSKEMETLSVDDISQMETIYLEFGRTPEQIFLHPHPSRFESIESKDSSVGVPISSQPSFAVPTVSSISVGFDGDSDVNIDSIYAKDQLSNDPGNQTQPSFLQFADEPNQIDPTSDIMETVCLSRVKQTSVVDDPNLMSPKFIGDRSTSSMCQTSSTATPLKNNLQVMKLSKFALGNPLTKDRIIDATLVDFLPRTRPSETCGTLASGIAVEDDYTRYAICSLSSDNYLRVHLGAEVLRSRLLNGACCLTTMDNGVVAYGTANGSIGYYHINSGRAQTMARHAHESRVSSIAFISGLQVLVSGARDASIKIWQLQRVRNGGAFALLCALELDAESPVLELAVTCNEIGSSSSADDEDLEWAVRRVIVAALTNDGNLLVWNPTEYSAGDSMLDPRWRVQVGSPTQAQMQSSCSPIIMQRICWLAPAHRQARSIAAISACGEYVRVWVPGCETSKAVIASMYASCIAASNSSRTLLIGNTNGIVEEYEDTGLRIGKQETQIDIAGLLVRCDRGGIFALSVDKVAIHMAVRST